MEGAWVTDFRIRLTPEHLSEGSLEERSAFGHVVIEAGDTLLSEGFDNFVELRRHGPLVSGYHLAEWLLWNWWRLRYEPFPSGLPTADWRRSHCMAEIGEGYAWPNVTIISDGRRSVIQSKPSERGEISSFRYYGAAHPAILPWSFVERGIDDFVESVMASTVGSGIQDTNLDRLWRDLVTERRDPEVGRFRRFEALLGADPDELPDEAIRRRLADADGLGEAAVDELAAAAAGSGIASVLSAAQVHESADEYGSEMRVGDSLSAKDFAATDALQITEDRSAAEVGVAAARLTRRRAGMRNGVMTDRLLADIAGLSPKALRSSSHKLPISFSLRGSDDSVRAVLRGKPRVNRRFDLARLIGERLIGTDEPLRPSTDARTYRQKAQRAFAAELLAPIDAVVERADEDFSDERKEEIGRYFQVSPMVIDRILKNNHVIERDANDLAEVA